MTKEEKELLLKDLSARLPYGVVCCCEWKDSAPNGTVGYAPVLDTYILDQIECIGECDDVQFKSCKPYLRPMSSMTEEEKEELNKTQSIIAISAFNDIKIMYATVEGFDWLNKKHFNWRGLPEDLYIEVTEKTNPYKIL